MKPLRRHAGIAVPLPQPNIDTDQIIPKQFLKRIERSGYGEFLFYDWRFTHDGAPDPAFLLNHPAYAGASILIAGRNFGCGSSREHAAWALLDFGFRIVIAPSFADIFSSNAVQNGILPLVLPEAQVLLLSENAARGTGYTIDVDLESCTWRDAADRTGSFVVDASVRRRLLEGLDDIGATLLHQEAIAVFEQDQRARRSWLTQNAS